MYINLSAIVLIPLDPWVFNSFFLPNWEYHTKIRFKHLFQFKFIKVSVENFKKLFYIQNKVNLFLVRFNCLLKKYYPSNPKIYFKNLNQSWWVDHPYLLFQGLRWVAIVWLKYIKILGELTNSYILQDIKKREKTWIFNRKEMLYYIEIDLTK